MFWVDQKEIQANSVAPQKIIVHENNLIFFKWAEDTLPSDMTYILQSGLKFHVLQLIYLVSLYSKVVYFIVI
jgi:hypothetical protein